MFGQINGRKSLKRCLAINRDSHILEIALNKEICWKSLKYSSCLFSHCSTNTDFCMEWSLGNGALLSNLVLQYEGFRSSCGRKCWVPADLPVVSVLFTDPIWRLELYGIPRFRVQWFFGQNTAFIFRYIFRPDPAGIAPEKCSLRSDSMTRIVDLGIACVALWDIIDKTSELLRKYPKFAQFYDVRIICRYPQAFLRNF